ncbi:hypothetical protein [Mariniflexile sp. HMF6888]|uniref:hypothetical protein n=1 Tax=Mariniflexile sp. HMF6888 TaxID=3373086 RepID=UPI0037B2A21B
MNEIKYLDYKKSKLVNFFVEYNKYVGDEYINYEKKQKRDLFNLSFRFDFNSSTLSIENKINDYKNKDFSNESVFRFGI